jgi:hypothetical protein
MRAQVGWRCGKSTSAQAATTVATNHESDGQIIFEKQNTNETNQQIILKSDASQINRTRMDDANLSQRLESYLQILNRQQRPGKGAERSL